LAIFVVIVEAIDK